MQLTGTTTLLTGATGGLGHAMARALCERGSKLVLTGRKTDVLEALASEIGAETVACDLSDRSAVADLAQKTAHVDILVANAGLPGSGDFRDLTDADVDRLLDVNLRAPIVLAHALGRHMVERGRGHIVFISSVSGMVASPKNSLYCATKFGLRGFAHSLRLDMAGTGVGVSVVLPGFVSEAGMFADAHVALPPGVRTISPQAVANDVVKAIEKNRGEVVSAPVELGIGARIGALSPRLSGRAQSSGLAGRSINALASSQRDRS